MMVSCFAPWTTAVHIIRIPTSPVTLTSPGTGIGHGAYTSGVAVVPNQKIIMIRLQARHRSAHQLWQCESRAHQTDILQKLRRHSVYSGFVLYRTSTAGWNSRHAIPLARFIRLRGCCGVVAVLRILHYDMAVFFSYQKLSGREGPGELRKMMSQLTTMPINNPLGHSCPSYTKKNDFL